MWLESELGIYYGKFRRYVSITLTPVTSLVKDMIDKITGVLEGNR